MFLDKDKEEALKEIECYHYLTNLAISALNQGRFEDAKTYHQNMIRSLGELKRLNNKKITTDRILNQIKSDQEILQVIATYGGKIK